MNKINELKAQVIILEQQEKCKQIELELEKNDIDYNLKIVNNIIRKRMTEENYWAARNSHVCNRELTHCLSSICNTLFLIRKEINILKVSNV